MKGNGPVRHNDLSVGKWVVTTKNPAEGEDLD